MITDSTIEKRCKRVLERHGLKLHRLRDEQGHREGQGVYYINEAHNDTRPDDSETYRFLSLEEVLREVEELEQQDVERQHG